MISDTKDIEVANLAKQEDEFAFLNGDVKDAEPTEPEETPVETPEEKPVEKPTEPTKIQHPRYLVEIARRLGASDDQIANIPTDQLGSMIEGHMAQIQASARQPEPAAAELVIEADNCVFHELAAKNPHICQFDLALLATFSGSPVELQQCMAKHDHICRFRFGGKEGA